MGYDLHIERPADDPDAEPIPIPLEEWRAAIAATEGVRLVTAAAHTWTNPASGQVLSVPAQDGDAEVFFPADGQWRSVFRWSSDGGAASSSARFDPGDLAHPVWIAAVALASRVGGAIRGDDGERYDLQTGEIVDR
jgi:hypothetical protein